MAIKNSNSCSFLTTKTFLVICGIAWLTLLHGCTSNNTLEEIALLDANDVTEVRVGIGKTSRPISIKDNREIEAILRSMAVYESGTIGESKRSPFLPLVFTTKEKVYRMGISPLLPSFKPTKIEHCYQSVWIGVKDARFKISAKEIAAVVFAHQSQFRPVDTASIDLTESLKRNTGINPSQEKVVRKSKQRGDESKVKQRFQGETKVPATEK